VAVPTLILHSVGDRMNEFKYGRRLASTIAGARLVALESDNHIVLEDEPAWQVFVDEVRRFLEPDQGAAPAAREAVEDILSARELEVLRMAASGSDNEAIAAELCLSVRTVERHLQNVYDKLGVRGRTARTAAAARLLTTG
jgi:DNA-binding NarL/FixJ family response regulator